MLVTNPRGLFQAVCTKWTYDGSMFFAVIPIAEYDGTAKMRTDHDRKMVTEFTKNPRLFDEYVALMELEPDKRPAVNPTDLKHEDMGTILIMTIKD